MSKYSVDYSANQIVNTITSGVTNAKYDQTDGKDHPDYGIPLNYIPNEGIVIAPDAVFIKPLNLVIMTEDNYNKLKEKKMNNDEITYEQVLEYCKKRNYALVDREYYFYMIGENPMEVWGVPIDEAQRVIEVYKYTHKIPSKDYQEGFEAGVKYMREQLDSIMAEEIKNIMGEVK